MTDFEEIEDQIVDGLNGDKPIRSTGSIKKELQNQGVIEDYGYNELMDHLEDMRERGLVELAHGEWNEYTLP
jgi:hypothetical protein